MYQHIPFLWLNNISLHGYTRFSISIHQFMDIWVVCFLAIMKNTAVNIHVHKSCIYIIFNFSWNIVSVYLTVFRNYQTVFKVFVHFILPQARYEISHCSLSLLTFGLVSLLNFNFLNGCVIMSHCGFNLYFTDD